MRRISLRWVPWICLHTLLFVCGCQQRQLCSSRSHSPVKVTKGGRGGMVSRSYSYRNISGQFRLSQRPALTTLTAVTLTSAEPSVARPSVAPPTAATDAPPTAATVAPPTAASVAPPTAATVAPPTAAIVQAVSRPAVPDFIPEPNRPLFAHDPKYHWLVGEIEYSRTERSWLLRYVSYEENDRYGGYVMLVGLPRNKKLRPGQMVSVKGSLIDPNSHQLRPAFEVQQLHFQ